MRTMDKHGYYALICQIISEHFEPGHYQNQIALAKYMTSSCTSHRKPECVVKRIPSKLIKNLNEVQAKQSTSKCSLLSLGRVDLRWEQTPRQLQVRTSVFSRPLDLDKKMCWNSAVC